MKEYKIVKINDKDFKLTTESNNFPYQDYELIDFPSTGSKFTIYRMTLTDQLLAKPVVKIRSYGNNLLMTGTMTVQVLPDGYTTTVTFSIHSGQTIVYQAWFLDPNTKTILIIPFEMSINREPTDGYFYIRTSANTSKGLTSLAHFSTLFY